MTQSWAEARTKGQNAATLIMSVVFSTKNSGHACIATATAKWKQHEYTSMWRGFQRRHIVCIIIQVLWTLAALATITLTTIKYTTPDVAVHVQMLPSPLLFLSPVT